MRRAMFIVPGLLALTLAWAHWILPPQLENRMNVRVDHAPYDITKRGRALHETLFVADLHTDSLLWKRDLLERGSRGHLDIPRLREGNVALQVFSATTKSPKGQNYKENAADSDQITALAVAQLWPPRTWDSIFERAVYQLDKLKAIEKSGELMLIRTRGDLDRLVELRGKGEEVVGAVYLIEGGHPLEGDIGRLDTLYEQGLRIVGLTHFFDNELGGSLHGLSGDGLSDFGRTVVRRANDLGLIIDIAHASPAMVEEVLELSTRPTILSHGGLKGVCDTPRNLDDGVMVNFAERGGLLGVGFWDAAVCDITPTGIVRALRYAVDLLGVDHVALGSDYDGATAVTVDAGELAVLTDEMLRQGFSEDEIRLIMGDNVKRFLAENLPREVL